MKTIIIDSKISVKNLSILIEKNSIELIKDFFLNGIFVNLNDHLLFENVKNLCKKIYNIEVLKKETNLFLENKNKIKIRKNIIFITITGNVDTGKSSLVDFILKRNNVELEVGNITQNVSVYDFFFFKKKIFLFDLPGHSLFNELININLFISDIIFYIISYEDNINYKKINEIILKFEKQSIKIILCINKYDKFKFGKKYLNFKNEKFFISAKTGFNIKNLLKKSIILFDKEKKYINLENPGGGFIVNSSIIDEVLITKIFIFKGILKKNYFLNFKYTSININEFYINEKLIDEIESPSLITIKNVQFPIETIFEINKKPLNNFLGVDYKDNYNNFYNFYIKTISHNIAYSIVEFYNNLKSNDTIRILKILVGNFNDNDIEYCLNFNCIIISVGLKIENVFLKKILNNKIIFKEYNLVYDLIEYFKNFYKCDKIEKTIGKLKIIKIFPSGKNSKIAGCVNIFGEINIKNNIKIYKNLKLIFKGKIKSIKINKKNKEIVFKNEECGVLIKNFNNFEINDIIESYVYLNDKKYIE